MQSLVNSDNFFANLVSNLTYSQYIAAHFENNRGLFTIQFPTNRNSQPTPAKVKRHFPVRKRRRADLTVD